MRKAYIVPLDDNHFELIADKITQIYLENPMDFLFIGPTGFYVRQIADIVAEKSGKTINRDAFLVINQYVTEFLKKNNYQAEVLDRDFYTVYISKIIGELYDLEKDKENSENSDRLLLLRTLLKSNTIVQYIVEIFERIWEIELHGSAVSLSSQYDIVNQLMNDTSVFAQIIRDILIEMKSAAKELQSRYMYDPINIYKWYAENAKDLEVNREHLIVSGFFNISPLTSQALAELVKKSENTIFFVWQKANDSAFNQIDEIYNFLEKNSFEFDDSLCNKKVVNLDELIKNKNISAVDVENQYNEYHYLVKQVKSLIMEGLNPEKIGVVVPNTNVAYRLMDEFDEAGIPYRYSGKNLLTESHIVKILLQPLLTIETGYRPEDLLAVIESPLVEKRELTMDEIEDLFKEYEYYSIRIKPSEMRNKEERRKNFFEKLERDIAELESKKEEYEIEEDVYLSSIERLEKLRKFKEVMEELFGLLDNIHENWGSKDFFEWYKEFIKSSILRFGDILENYEIMSSQKSVIRSVGKEINALSKFISVLNKLEIYVQKLRGSKLSKITSWSKLIKLFVVLLNSNGYRETFKSANVVDIIDISTSKFVKKEYKFIVDFIDDYYPSISKINPLLYRTTSQRSKIYDLLEESERSSILLSIIFSQNSCLIFPKSTNTGDPLVPSKYLSELAHGHIDAKISSDDIFKKIDYDIYKLAQSASQSTEMKKEDFIVGESNITEFSHSRIATYLSCPMLFYYSNIATLPVKTKENNLALMKGIITHRVLAKLFDINYPKNVYSLLNFNDEVLKELIKESAESFSEGVFKYKIPKKILSDEIFDKLSVYLREFANSKYLITLGQKSKMLPLKLDSSRKSKEGTKDLYTNETLKTELSVKCEIGRYYVIGRIDRIDKILDEGNKYAIVDYKNSLSSIRFEQLVLYDYLILKGENSENLLWKGEIKEDFSQVFLTFFKIGQEKIEYRYIKKENQEEPVYIIEILEPNISFTLNDFEKWLISTMDDIALKGIFTPVFLMDQSRTFFSILSEKGNIDKSKIKGDMSKMLFENRKCRGYNNICPYESLCSAYEIYGVKLLKE